MLMDQQQPACRQITRSQIFFYCKTQQHQWRCRTFKMGGDYGKRPLLKVSLITAVLSITKTARFPKFYNGFLNKTVLRSKEMERGNEENPLTKSANIGYMILTKIKRMKVRITSAPTFILWKDPPPEKVY